MWLGGVRIVSETGFVAHSDGDVAIHALCDALLGCLALGDIGHHFPDNSDAWKGADSKMLLAKVVGCMLPMAAKAVKLDPAVMASPFISTIVDALSLLVYFSFAKTLLGI